MRVGLNINFGARVRVGVWAEAGLEDVGEHLGMNLG